MSTCRHHFERFVQYNPFDFVHFSVWSDQHAADQMYRRQADVQAVGQMYTLPVRCIPFRPDTQVAGQMYDLPGRYAGCRQMYDLPACLHDKGAAAE